MFFLECVLAHEPWKAKYGQTKKTWQTIVKSLAEELKQQPSVQSTKNRFDHLMKEKETSIPKLASNETKLCLFDILLLKHHFNHVLDKDAGIVVIMCRSDEEPSRFCQRRE